MRKLNIKIRQDKTSEITKEKMDVIKESKMSSLDSNEADQTRPDNPLQKSNADIEKILSVKCKIHTKKNAEYLHIIPNVLNPRICISCI